MTSDVLPWHFQWLDGFYLYRSLRKILPSLGGKVLDVGCGKKPYQKLFGSIEEYVGLDVIAGPMVDVVVQPYERWPFYDDYFDVVLLTQVLEHAENLSQLLVETKRAVKPGVIVASFPFIYNEHGIPDDYWRISAYGGQRLFPDVTLLKIERQGGIGSTIALLLLNWWEDTLNLNNEPLRIYYCDQPGYMRGGPRVKYPLGGRRENLYYLNEELPYWFKYAPL